jgi:hypothetical protein
VQFNIQKKKKTLYPTAAVILLFRREMTVRRIPTEYENNSPSFVAEFRRYISGIL